MNHVVEFAHDGDFENLFALWRMSFNDSDEYIQNFFKMMYKPGYALVSRVEGVAVSCAFLLETQLVIGGRPHSAYYFYAASTHPKYRNQGHMGAIINAAEEVARERGIDFIVLVPAEEDLFRYYAKFGFETKFYKKVVYFTREELKALALEPDLTYAFNLDIFATRQDSLPFNDFLNWGEAALKYAMYAHNSESGSIAFTSDGYAMYNVGKDIVYVKEMCTVAEPGELFTMLLMEDEAEKFTFNLPVGSAIHSNNEKVVKVGMCLALNESAQVAATKIKDGYIGITLG